MTIVLSDRVKQTSVTSGSGSITLTGSFGGFTTFASGVGDGNQTYYGVENESRWEVGLGTYSGGILTRDTILQSSQSDAKINLDGVSIVFCTYPADKAVFKDANGDINLASGVVFPSTSEFDGITISGNMLFQPYNNQVITAIRTSSGNFFQAYVDDAYDRTIGLYTNAGSSPQWRLGVKSDPTFPDMPPTYAYVYGEDGDMGLVADSTNSVILSNAGGFVLKHKNDSIFKASSVTGIHVNSDSITSPALTVNGPATLATSIQEWTTSAGSVLSLVDSDGSFAIKRSVAVYDLDVNGSGRFTSAYFTSGVIFPDGSMQTSAASVVSSDLAHVSGIAVFASGQTAVNAASIAVNTSNIILNSSSGVAISGWAASTFVTTDTNTTYTAGSGLELVGTEFNFVDYGQITANSASGVAISGWASSTFSTTDTDTTYGAGSGMVLQGGSFHSVNTYEDEIRANSSSGVVISGIASAAAAAAVSYSAGSGMTLQDTAFHFADYSQIRDNSSSGVAISGWAANTFITTDANTTYTAGSGMSLQGGVFHFVNQGDITSNSSSGVAISGWAAATFVTSDTNTTYTGGSGITLQGGSFHAVNTFGADILANTSSGVSVSGWAAATFLTSDSDTTYTAGSGLTLVGTEFNITSISDTQINVQTLGSPTYTTQRDLNNVGASNGLISGGVITDGGGGTIDISAGSVLIRTTNSDTGELLSADFGAVTSQVLTDNSPNFIYVDYNSGSPQFNIVTAALSNDIHTNVHIGIVYRDGTGLHITPISSSTSQFNQKANRRLTFVNGLTRQDGSIISEVGVRNIAITAGDWWLGLDEYSTAAVDTSVSSTFTYYYRDGIGGFTKVASQTAINNTKYDDGTGTLANLTGTRKGVHWVYQGVDDDIYVVYGHGNYTTAQASNATPPTPVPVQIGPYHSALVGKIVVQKDASSFVSIQTPFSTVFSLGTVQSHGDLSDLTDDDHTQYLLVNGSRAMTGSITAVGMNSSQSVTASGFVASSGGVEIYNVIPSVTTNKLYNNAGALWFNGSVVNTDTDTNTTYTGGSGITLQDGVFHATNTFGSEILANSASGVAVSGWAASTFITTDTNTTYTAGSGMVLQDDVFHSVNTFASNILSNSSSGVAISGWAASTFITTDTDTTYTAGSGMVLQGDVFHASNTFSDEIVANSSSGVAISGWAANTFVSTDTDTTYTAGSGLTLVGTEFNTQGSGNFEGLIIEKAVKRNSTINTDGATVTFDMNESNTHLVTMGGSRTFAVSNVASGQWFGLRVTQDGTGSRGITWFSNIKWSPNGDAPTPTTTANKTDMFMFYCDAPNNYDGYHVGSGI